MRERDDSKPEWDAERMKMLCASMANAVYAFEQQITCLWLFEKHRSINFPSFLLRLLSFTFFLIMCYIIDSRVGTSTAVNGNWRAVKRFSLLACEKKMKTYPNIVINKRNLVGKLNVKKIIVGNFGFNWKPSNTDFRSFSGRGFSIFFANIKTFLWDNRSHFLKSRSGVQN